MNLSPTDWVAILRVVLSGAVLFFLPGWLLQDILIRRGTVISIARFPLSFVFSVGAIALLGLIVFAAGGGLTTVQVLLVALIVGLAGIRIRRRLEPEERVGETFGWPDVLVLAFAAVCAVLAYLGGAWLSDKADGFYHLAAIHRQIDTGSALAQGVFYAYRPNQLNPTTGTWHLALSLFSLWSGADITWLWVRLPALLAPLMVTAFYTFARKLLTMPWLALFCTLLQFVLYDKLDFRNAVYSNQAGYILLWLAFVLTLDYLEAGSRRLLAILLATVLVIVSWHLLLPELFFVTLGAYLVARLIVLRIRRQPFLSDTESKRLLGLILPVVLVGVPFLAYRALRSNLINPANWTSVVSERVTFRSTLRLPGGLAVVSPLGLYIVDPRWRFAPFRFAFWLFAYLGTPFLLPAALKGRRFALFLLASMAIVPLILFNPVLITLAQGKVPDNMFLRLVLLPPYGMMLGWFFWEVTRIWLVYIRRCPRIGEWGWGATARRVAAVAGGAAIGLMAAVVLWQGGASLWDLYASDSQHVYSIAASRRNAVLPTDPSYLYVIENTSPTAVIATDPESGYYVAALTGRSIISVPLRHYPPMATPPHWTRREDSVRILDPAEPLTSTVELLDSYQTCFAWVDARMSATERPVTGAMALGKLDALPDLFAPAYRDSDISIYAYSRRKPDCTP